MILLDKFQIAFKKNIELQLPKEYTFIVAVSGGVDSVVLVHLLHQIQINFVISHCNFQLRGEESKRDELFVLELGKKFDKEVLIKHFETENFAVEQKISIQLAARNLRYDWFATLQENFTPKPCYVLTAHHLNDNVETVFINFCRGTGVEGLTGIKVFDNERKIIRPLLSFTKVDILQYAKQYNLKFVEDSSNASNKYTRNHFRNEILPLIQQQFVNVEENISKNIHRFNDVSELYHQAISHHKKSLLKKVGEEVHISILQLKKVKPLQTIVFEIFKSFEFSSSQVDEIIKLLDADNGSFISNENYRILVNRKWLIVSSINNQLNKYFIIEEKTKKFLFDSGTITLEKITNSSNFQISKNLTVITINADEVSYPLLLRKWKQGDYFYPLGMAKKQKLSKFFINQKLSLTDKEKVWVIESNKKIIWIVEHRIDNRFKITPQTKNILKISYLK